MFKKKLYLRLNRFYVNNKQSILSTFVEDHNSVIKNSLIFLECIKYCSFTLIIGKLLQNSRFESAKKTLENTMRERQRSYCVLILIVIICIDLTIPRPLNITSAPKDKIQKENIGETLWSKFSKNRSHCTICHYI